MKDLLPLGDKVGADHLQNIRGRAKATETYRTPLTAFTPFVEYRREWFVGSGADPSAGDGRMALELLRLGLTGPFFLGDIRQEEGPRLLTIAHSNVIMGDYLVEAWPEVDFLFTNPPFALAQAFVEKGLTHCKRVMILQSVAFQGTARRSGWLKRNSGLRLVLNLPKRPRWELDSGDKVASNIWDFAWFVFERGYQGKPEMDWLISNERKVA